MKLSLGAILLALLAAPSLARPSEVPTRAIFDEGMYWASSPSEVFWTLRRVKRAGFNTYIPCVWHGQGATWRSKVAPVWDRNPDVAARDALATFITAAHKEGIKVFPCFTLALRQREFLREFTSESRPEGVFNIQNEAFRRFATDLVLEVVKNYDIDGINLDYVRAGQVCYDTTCRQQYSDTQGRNLMLDLAVHKVNNVAFDSIVAWQRRAVRDLIAGISTEARKIRPGLVISVDAAPWAESVLIEGQDSLAWADEGLVDTVMSMNYSPVIDWSLLRGLQDKMKRPEQLLIMVGNYDGEAPAKPISRSGTALLNLVDEAAAFHPNGSFAVYIYSLLTDEQIMKLATRKN